MYFILLSVSVASRATESRRDKEEVGDSSWTLTAKRLDAFAGPDEIKRREVVLDPQEVSPEETMSMEVELGCESWTFFASVVSQQWRSCGHCLCQWLCSASSWNSNCVVH